MKLPKGKTLASARTHPCVRAERTHPRGRNPASARMRAASTPTPPDVRADASYVRAVAFIPSFASPPLPPPLRTQSAVRADADTRENFLFFIFLAVVARLKREKKISVIGFQSPSFPSSPRSAGFAGKAARRRRFFRPSSSSHPSKLYSSLGWLNSKVPKPFSPFSLRLIDVDGF
jgi:hypothetical protein